MRVLSWNLFHGRSDPPAGRDLYEEFAVTIAGWDWDVALLQEVPPWWPAPLGHRAHASARMRLTSRNWLGPLRRALAIRWPDLMKSEGGGCNAILVRHQSVLEHHAMMLSGRPERRYVHAVLLVDGTWIANLHASKRETGRTEEDVRRADAALHAWSRSEPRALLGGDFNIGEPQELIPRLAKLGGGGLDYVLGRGFERVAAERLDAGPLSDHAPILVEVRPAAQA
jgi:endonuclease/exonuclease/phosphatase family metal-dependent hydrolase